MADYVIKDTTLTGIADAIRSKTGKSEQILTENMETEIMSISGSSAPVIEELNVTTNGTYNVPEGVDGYNPVTVNVSGGDLPPEALVISGDCEYRFANKGWDWFIKAYGDRVTTRAISDARNMFFRSTVEEIPFDLNFKTFYAIDLFRSCNNLKKLPKRIVINGWITTNAPFSEIFSYCYNLRYIDTDFVINDYSRRSEERRVGKEC